ncbi:sulfatase-like hydrolase/transferase [Luteolibacter sp. SL250]|uniref:sulfatase-like hydrolase/transferase n=1 Tax=Luteolibacter sp. SL250 TaxID=2995170 RepID=UPI00226E1095|nr:sulfatase-like hydrolase/transferase [Luteolibacter sp. SL250]WAC20488.1 sulfatase-like hydrolase/transferase [Luteolibacter sp. SL250]
MSRCHRRDFSPARRVGDMLNRHDTTKMKIPTSLLLLFSSVLPLAAQAKKNVLLIAVDDLKPLIGAYGDPHAKTPNIDRLAARGILFEHAYTNQAVCAPSRNSLLTGITPGTLGIYDLATNFRKAAPDAITLPQQFIRNGYRAEAVGKLYHSGHGNGDDAASWSVPHVKPSGKTYALDTSGPPEGTPRRKNGKAPRGAAVESADVPDDTYADGLTANEVIKRLEAAKERPDTPFFIGAGFIRPHLPFVAPKKYWDLYTRSDLKVAEYQKAPEGAPDAAMRPNGELSQYRGAENSGNLSEAQQLELIHGYYAATSYTDAQVGKLLDALDRLGLSENTIVVLWGDHGWHLGDHGLWAKHSNFEQATRIPFIISAPGVTAPGGKTKSLVQSIDLYPTLLELTGLPHPGSKPALEGKSLVPVLKDPAATVNEVVYQVYPRGPLIGRSLRTATHRLVEWKAPGAAPETAEWELYDYGTDPAETRNLVKDQPETVAALKPKLAALPEAKKQIKVTELEKETATKKPAAGRDRAKLFANRDKNHDGILSREEFLANQEDQTERFTRFDKNKDGSLSREEFISAGK